MTAQSRAYLNSKQNKLCMIRCRPPKDDTVFLSVFLCFSSSNSAFHSHGNEAQLQGETMEILPFMCEMLLFRHISW